MRPRRPIGGNRRGRRALPLAFLGLLALGAGALRAAEPALEIAEGSRARRQVVAVGRDVVVAGEAMAEVAAIDGSVEVSGRVGGDVIVLGGDVRLAAGAVVAGDVYALGGEVHAAPGAAIEGRTVSYPSVSQAWLTLAEGPSLGLPASSALVVGAKVGLLAAWLTLVLLLFATSGREVLATSDSVAESPFRNFAIGVTAVFSLAMTGLFLSSFAAAVVGIPILFLVVLAAVLLKLWGMVAVFHALGAWVARRFGRRLLPLSAATAGLAALGVIKLLPFLGVWVWTVATFVGVGAALSTKLGRREPWLAAP